MKKAHDILRLIVLLGICWLTCFDMAACASPGTIRAFPGAEGEGQWSKGGRGGKVIFVDNLNDSGPGSFRAALEADGKRTILFRVSGTIELNSSLDIRDSYCTIAGQTAPGEGICLKDGGIELYANNVVIRHIRSRTGDAANADGISVGDCQDVIIDHCSTTWAADENLSVGDIGTDRITVQYSVLGEGLMDHSFGSLIGSDVGKVTYHHNFYISNRSRNPRPWDLINESDQIGPKIDFVNNVIYNWGNGGPGYTGGENETPTMNYIGNYLKGGPDSPSSQVAIWCNGPTANNIFYVAGNYFEGQGGYVRNQYSLLSGNHTALDSPFPTEAVTIDDAVTARDKVLADAGAFPWNRDEVDHRLANDFWNRTGALIESQNEVGGWPELYSLPYPTDDDNDGIPNYWETQYSVSDINGDTDSDGYTNLEEYLNNTNPTDGSYPIVYVGATDSRANEAGMSPGEFTVFRTGNTSAALTVNYTVSGSATAGLDYEELSGSVTIPGGVLEAAITVIPVDDSNTEGPEQVIINIDTDSNYKVGLPSATLVVIIDDGSGEDVEFSNNGINVIDKHLSGRAGKRYEMTMSQAGQRWDRGLPTGNGRLGAMVYGNVANETIILNHDSLFIRSEKPVLPDVSEHVPEMRKMVAEGRYVEAEEFFEGKIRQDYDYRGPDSFHPAFNITVDMPVEGKAEDVRRAVDFETGVVSVSWQQDNVSYLREVFVSRADNVAVMRISASRPGMVNCALGFMPTDGRREELGDGRNVRVPRFLISSIKNKISLDEVPITFNLTADKNRLTLLAEYDVGGSYHMVGGEYGGYGLVKVKGGSAKTADLQVAAEKADEVLMIVKLFANEPSRSALPSIRKDVESLPADYDKLLQRHVELHRELFLRVKLDLGGKEAFRSLSNEELIAAAKRGEALNAMQERLFDFGRFAFICSSSVDGMPANLQGIWGGEYGPAWSADYHNDINIQMNYSQALPGNMVELSLPYFDYYESMVEDYRTNAGNIYGCGGIWLPICQTTNGLCYNASFVSWTGAGGWLAQLFYDYWLFTRDRDFLARRAVPFMKEVALFYEDFLFEGKDGKYIFSPSHSPENTPRNQNTGGFVINATMDIAVTKELLSNLIKPAKNSA